MTSRQAGILLFDQFEELDAVGPNEVLAAWSAHVNNDWSVSTMSFRGEGVRGAKGLVIRPHMAVEDAPHFDLLLYHGGQGTRPPLADDEHLDWVRSVRKEVPLIASVCTRSLVLAGAGLLAGRPATTHWASLDHLGELDPTIDVRRDVRFVDDGDVVTSAGVSAGIDMALHLVARLGSIDRARDVRRIIQYDPDPPV